MVAGILVWSLEFGVWSADLECRLGVRVWSAALEYCFGVLGEFQLYAPPS